MPRSPGCSVKRGWLAGAALCATLTACAVSPPSDGTYGTVAGSAVEGRGTADAAAPQDGSETASLRPAPVPVDANPARLKGLDRAGLAAILGAPVFQRVDGGAALLRYRNTSCVLDLFLYAPPKGGRDAARVEYIEARDIEGAAMKPHDCFAALLRARQETAG